MLRLCGGTIDDDNVGGAWHHAESCAELQVVASHPDKDVSFFNLQILWAAEGLKL